MRAGGYDEEDIYTSTAKKDPVRLPEGTPRRVRRGGAYNGTHSFVRSAQRFHNTPGFSMNSLGMRPARSIR